MSVIFAECKVVNLSVVKNVSYRAWEGGGLLSGTFHGKFRGKLHKPNESASDQ